MEGDELGHDVFLEGIFEDVFKEVMNTACLGLVHGDDPERCYGEGGGRGVHVWERM